MGKMSVTKGSSYERGIAKILSNWCGFKLIRTPMSGAWAGTSGDIIPENSNQAFPLLVECKKTEDWCMEAIIAGRGCFYEWLAQVKEELVTDKAMTGLDKKPLLIFSRNNKPNYVAYFKASMPHCVPPNINHITLSDPAIIILQLSDFVSRYDYRTLVNHTGDF